jgi:hypothetical protein
VYQRYIAFVLGLVAALSLVTAAINRLVDPFGVAAGNALGLDRQYLAERSNDRLAALLRYRRQPQPTVLLGDSRTKNLSEEYFAQQGLAVSNLAYGGGTLAEAIDTFWFVVEHGQPRQVVIGLPFNLWSDANDHTLVPAARGLVEHPATYYFNLDILRLSLTTLARNALGSTRPDSVPPMSSEEFWRYQLEYNARSFYLRWRKPQHLEQRLKEVVRYCDGHAIQLAFIIPPTHVELQEKIAEYGLRGQFSEYMRTLHALGTVIDYDGLAQTRDRRFFSDPFHGTPELSRQVAGDLVQRLAAMREQR